MKRFDPASSRRNAFTPGMLALYVARDPKPGDMLGGTGEGETAETIWACLVGLADVFLPLLPRRLAWIEHAIATWERLTERSGMKSLGRSPSARQMGYAYCLHRMGRLALKPGALHAGGRRMLVANLQGNWLAYGQFIRAATWLKIVHGQHDPTLAPLQALLAAYADMPDVEKPAFLAGNRHG